MTRNKESIENSECWRKEEKHERINAVDCSWKNKFMLMEKIL